ncbi:arginine-ornithine antiporter [Weizmannia acidilactici]|uniref:arginine-ornithine antiporter n=1 Tax=Weizmannia acidilactici TaxID=2607726 RepID=UPI00124CB111|nr:arginine-ornithine antiporter [Weizmannia acidilactici]GER72471.1 arginine-ornithine antiporter [Weizmannia acidilactici]
MGDQKKLSLLSLIAIVIGSMIGGGAFNLASDISNGAHAGAIIIGWVITGIGIIALGLCFQNLSMRRPDLDGGIYSYAKAGFGSFMGFNSAFGYWLSAWLGNVAYATLLFSSIGYFIPGFDGGQNVASIIGASIMLWIVHALVLRGVHSAALVNLVTTITKLVPVFLFIVIMIFAFHAKTFTADFWGPHGTAFHFGNVAAQVKSTMLVTLWVFIGVEGAVVLSGRAQNRKDIGKATVIGLIGTLVIYILISLLSLGVMAQGELVGLPNPSMAYLLEHVVGKWGAVIINLGLIISVLGAWLGWTILAAEIPFVAGKDDVFPAWFAKENKNHAPVNSLWLTNGLIQLFLITLLFTDRAYQFAYSMASSAILIPYLFSALYQLKLATTGQYYEAGEKRAKDIVLGIIATVYAVWLVYAAGLDYLLLTMILYAPGILIFVGVQKEHHIRKFFNRAELLEACLIVFLALWALVSLITGSIKI